MCETFSAELFVREFRYLLFRYFYYFLELKTEVGRFLFYTPQQRCSSASSFSATLCSKSQCWYFCPIAVSKLSKAFQKATQKLLMVGEVSIQNQSGRSGR